MDVIDGPTNNQDLIVKKDKIQNPEQDYISKSENDAKSFKYKNHVTFEPD